MLEIFKQFLPPVLIRSYRSFKRYGWFGNYQSWSEASQNCSGYDHNLIFDKVKNASIKVKNGEAKYERDSVLFNTEDYNWPMLSLLLFIESRQKGFLHVVDFGGSLGSFFFQHKKLLSAVPDLKWSVVEQEHFVAFGKVNLSTDNLFFHHNIQEALTQQRAQILFLSSVLQYLEKPFQMIDELISYGFEYILIDRTAFTKKDVHELTIQKVDPQIYDASYPAWFFNENEFLRPFLKKYDLFLSLENSDYTNKKNAYFKGFFLIKK